MAAARFACPPTSVEICGLKPTPRRIPASGHFPASALHSSRGRWAAGPDRRRFRDSFPRDGGPDIGDTSAAPVAFRRLSEEEARRIRIGYFEDDGRTRVTPETRAAVRQAAETLQQQGFAVTSFRPEGLEQARQAWWVLFGLAGGMLFQPMVAGREAELGPILRELIGVVRVEPPLTAERLLNTLIERDVLREQLLRQMNEFPVLLCPVAAGPTFRHSEIGWSTDGHLALHLDTMRYSQWCNLLGNPAATVPVGRSPEGLPIGVQVVGRPWEEQNVLAIAARIERGRGGWQRPPLDN